VLVDRLEHDADPRVRAEAAWSLGRSAAAQDPTVRSALVRGLNSTVGAVRIHCAAGLVRAPRGLVSWSDLREDALVGVRAAATAALSGSPAPTESRALLVGDEHPFVRRAAQSASEAPSASSDWSVLHLLDRDGNPLPGAWALLSLPGGLPRVVQSDSEGSVRLEGVPRGEILIELLDREP
jgi:hypothetical protein